MEWCLGTRTLHHDNFLALAGLLALHAMFAWVLTRAMRPPTTTETGLEAALQVVLLPSRKTAARPERSESRNSTVAGQTATNDPTHKDRPVPSTAAQPARASAVDATRSPTPLQAILMGQAAAARVAPIEFAAPDVLADRQVHLPGHGGGRFRMHERLSPEQVVAMVGKLFGGMSAREVRATVCARNRQNLANAAVGGDSPELQVELETRRRYCNS
jgi:hypothetical protein